jgi:hypothetical protein
MPTRRTGFSLRTVIGRLENADEEARILGKAASWKGWKGEKAERSRAEPSSERKPGRAARVSVRLAVQRAGHRKPPFVAYGFSAPRPDRYSTAFNPKRTD